MTPEEERLASLQLEKIILIIKLDALAACCELCASKGVSRSEIESIYQARVRAAVHGFGGIVADESPGAASLIANALHDLKDVPFPWPEQKRD